MKRVAGTFFPSHKAKKLETFVWKGNTRRRWARTMKQRFPCSKGSIESNLKVITLKNYVTHVRKMINIDVEENESFDAWYWADVKTINSPFKKRNGINLKHINTRKWNNWGEYIRRERKTIKWTKRFFLSSMETITRGRGKKEILQWKRIRILDLILIYQSFNIKTIKDN